MVFLQKILQFPGTFSLQILDIQTWKTVVKKVRPRRETERKQKEVSDGDGANIPNKV